MAPCFLNPKCGEWNWNIYLLNTPQESSYVLRKGLHLKSWDGNPKNPILYHKHKIIQVNIPYIPRIRGGLETDEDHHWF